MLTARRVGRAVPLTCGAVVLAALDPLGTPTLGSILMRVRSRTAANRPRCVEWNSTTVVGALAERTLKGSEENKQTRISEREKPLPAYRVEQCRVALENTWTKRVDIDVPRRQNLTDDVVEVPRNIQWMLASGACRHHRHAGTRARGAFEEETPRPVETARNGSWQDIFRCKLAPTECRSGA